MAIDVTTLQPSTHGFALNATSANASGGEEILATPGAGKKLVLRSIIISCVSAISVTILAGATTILGPVLFTAAAPVFSVSFNPSIELAANTALNVTASGVGAICVFVQGDVK